tara:strand:+ start:830 stop:2380 length:1551 start_codon:yes stop_codon:yes gene_type:complete
MKFSDLKRFSNLPSVFIQELLGILSDHKKIYTDNREMRTKALEIYKEKVDKDEKIPSSLIKKIIRPDKSMDRASIALFIYSQTVFERFLSELMNLSIKLSDDLWGKYLDDIMECDKRNAENGKYKEIRDKEWEYMSLDKRKTRSLDRFKDIFGSTSDYLIRTSSYCGIDLVKDSVYWDANNPLTKFLIYDFSEITQRRNLLVHRGLIFDEMYLHNLNYDVKKRYTGRGARYAYEDSIIKKRKTHFADRAYYATDNKKLIGESAQFAPQYIDHTITTQILILMKFWTKLSSIVKKQDFDEKKLLKEMNKDKKSNEKIKLSDLKTDIEEHKKYENRITNILHMSLNESKESGISPLIIADKLFKQFISEMIIGENYINKSKSEIKDICESIGSYSSVNYLLIRSEIRRNNIIGFKKLLKKEKTADRIKIIKSRIAKIKKNRTPLENAIEEYVLEQEDPMFKVAINITHGRKKQAVKELSKCKGYKEEDCLEWFMFDEIKNDYRYKKEFRRSLKKACSR